MFAEFESLLQRTMGLDVASIGPTAIERAVQQRILVRGLRDVSAYWEHVNASAAELQELIEAVVVPETWFFRDREAFVALTRVVFEEWLRTHAEGVLRLLSLPCSTGEEPYSMAMALLDAGFPAERFRIDAIDISGRALAHARHATYGKNSFRGGNVDFRDRHFVPAGAGWQVTPAVQRQVNFQAGNLFDDGLLPGTEIYDIVFCRNVLIYFDRATQDRAIGVLQRLLTPKGCLFVGPSETGLLLSHEFVSAKIPLAFAFRRTEAVLPGPKTDGIAPLKRPSSPRPVAKPAPVSTRLPAFTAVDKPPAKTTETAGAAINLEAASRLADQGSLVDAAKLCEAHLRTHGPTAKAYYLLGLVRDASGNHAEAGDLYRKALYLDPRHPEALVHLAFILENQGNHDGAKILHDRARRLETKAVK